MLFYYKNLRIKECIRIESLIETCYKKINHEIDDSWDDLAKKYGFKNNEAIRCWFKKYRNATGEIGTKNKTRILHISDMHYPYNVPKEVFKDYIGKVDILVINGDEQDCQSISKFRKKYRIPFVDEMIGTRQMIIDIIGYIKPKKVILNYGNHNQRLISYFSDKVHEDLLTLMPETNLDFIVDLGFWKHDHQNKSKTFFEPLTKVFDGILVISYSKSWWSKVGKSIFCHPRAYKSGILGTVEKSYLYFLQLGEDFDTIVMAHTHQQGFCRYGKTYLYESGALCHEQSYSTDGGMMKPQSKGFVYIVQDIYGNLIYDESKIICL